MMNARMEFSEHTHQKVVLCADVVCGGREVRLQVGGSIEDFLCAMDFDYEKSYGRQHLYGTIWYTDGTWSDRGEYDGSEWWEHHARPDVPGELTAKIREEADKLTELIRLIGEEA